MPRVSPLLLTCQMVCALRSLCHSCPPPTDTPPACAPLPRLLDCDAFRCRSLLGATPPIAGSTAAPTWPLRSTPFADAHCVVWKSAHVSACPPTPPTPTSIRNNSPHPLSTKSDADRRSPAPASARSPRLRCGYSSAASTVPSVSDASATSPATVLGATQHAGNRLARIRSQIVRASSLSFFFFDAPM